LCLSLVCIDDLWVLTSTLEMHRWWYNWVREGDICRYLCLWRCNILLVRQRTGNQNCKNRSGEYRTLNLQWRNIQRSTNKTDRHDITEILWH
jgi:hypothetical protein